MRVRAPEPVPVPVPVPAPAPAPASASVPVSVLCVCDFQFYEGLQANYAGASSKDSNNSQAEKNPTAKHGMKPALS